ncbi:MAG: hypothetical protein NXH83_19640 [Rhodobacteraceae bacterium]|nr:hypothetical protein [Paracoccaceae bacterium]
MTTESDRQGREALYDEVWKAARERIVRGEYPGMDVGQVSDFYEIYYPMLLFGRFRDDKEPGT